MVSYQFHGSCVNVCVTVFRKKLCCIMVQLLQLLVILLHLVLSRLFTKRYLDTHTYSTNYFNKPKYLVLVNVRGDK